MASPGLGTVVARVAGPRTCTEVVPAARATTIVGLAFATELKSVGRSHAAVHTRSSDPTGPLTTSLVSPTRGSQAGRSPIP